jgi:predicted TIM-barrel fold metal-dependent hydrolase
VITIQGAAVRVIDAHVHIFPEDISGAREQWLERDRWFRDLYENPKSILATAEDLIASMDNARVDHSIVCGFPWSDNAHCSFHNAYMADAVERFPDRLSWLGIVSPNDDGERAAEDCLRGGALGIGELNADAQDFTWIDADAFAHVAAVAEAFGKPVMVHASEPLGHHYPGKGEATPDHILALAEAFPNLKIVAAHWGGGLPFFELMPEVRESLANVTYDSAATTYLYDQSIFGHVMNICGPAKIIFASDFPVLRQDRLVARLQAMEWPSIEAARLVMGANAETSYGIGAWE